MQSECPNLPERFSASRRPQHAGKSEPHGLKFASAVFWNWGSDVHWNLASVAYASERKPRFSDLFCDSCLRPCESVERCEPGRFWVNNSKLRFVRNGYARFPPLRRIYYGGDAIPVMNPEGVALR